MPTVQFLDAVPRLLILVAWIQLRRALPLPCGIRCDAPLSCYRSGVLFSQGHDRVYADSRLCRHVSLQYVDTPHSSRYRTPVRRWSSAAHRRDGLPVIECPRSSTCPYASFFLFTSRSIKSHLHCPSHSSSTSSPTRRRWCGRVSSRGTPRPAIQLQLHQKPLPLPMALLRRRATACEEGGVASPEALPGCLSFLANEPASKLRALLPLPP